MTHQDKKFTYSVPWNCFLVLAGTFIQAIGFKALGEPHGFVPGGLFGVRVANFFQFALDLHSPLGDLRIVCFGTRRIHLPMNLLK